jgi:hypothetical protein
MSSSHRQQWNPKYLGGCVQRTLELLGTRGVVVDLLSEAATHLECTGPSECRYFRQQLQQKANRVKKARRIKTWEYWLLKAAEQILQPVPGVKHSAVTMLRSALDEHEPGLGSGWQEWHQQHTIQEPAYL